MQSPRSPSRDELAAAAQRTVPDVIAPGLAVLFCGINPGLYSAAVGHHFARPGNRFWPTLHAAGFTDRILAPCEERQLLRFGYGITNLVDRATATAAELTVDELRQGGRRLVGKVRKMRPRVLAVVGIDAYRKAFDRPRASAGPQEDSIAGVPVWVLPNPSGLNTHYRLAELAHQFRALRASLDPSPGEPRPCPATTGRAQRSETRSSPSGPTRRP